MDMIALILSIIGSLNWGLVALFKFDLVAWLFGGQTALLSRIVYTVIALAGLWCATFLFRKDRKEKAFYQNYFSRNNEIQLKFSKFYGTSRKGI